MKNTENSVEYLIACENISKNFGGLTALQNLNFSVVSGEIIGLIGPNGAGKTTLFNIITGVHKPTKGSIFFKGEEISKLRPDQICHLGISRTFQLVRPFMAHTVLQNVMVAMLYGRDEKNLSMKKAALKSEFYLELVDLSNKRNIQASNLNLVERKRLEIARALATEPSLLLLDELFAGLNPTEAIHMIELIKSINNRDVTIIIIEHLMKVIMDLSDRVIVLNYGIKIAEGLPKEIIKDRKVIEAYLGKDVF